MDPYISFQRELPRHLDRQRRRDVELRQNQNWTVEIFRQSSQQSIRNTHLRDAQLEIQNIEHSIAIMVREIQILMPVIIWVWDLVKNKPELLAHLSAIEEKVRDQIRHHVKHGHFFELYSNHRQQGFEVFSRALADLTALLKEPNCWLDDPLSALRQIYDSQNCIVLTGLFLELLYETVKSNGLLSFEQEKALGASLIHLAALGQKLHLKEERLRQAIKSTQTMPSFKVSR